MPTDALVAGVQVTAVDARTLNVVLPQPADVALFARSEFAVAAGEFEGGWPVGTGAHRPKTDMPTDRPMMSSFAPASIRLEGSTPIEVRMVSGDLRDALDRGVDVLVTMDAAAIDYARAAPTFDVLPFSWSTSYLLVAPAATLPGGSPSGDSAPLVIAPPADALAALARDAVRVEARPAGMTSGSCGPGGQVSLSGGGFGAPAARVIFPSDDPLARSLAERLVALALAPARPESAWLRESVPELNGGAVRVAAVGLAADAFDAATLSGRDAAYVLPLDRAGASDPCAFERSVVARAPWLVAPVNVTRGRAAAILPLIDARASVLARVGVVGLSVDASGVLLLEHARRVPPESLR
jgi:hypothetical protein